jgi:hypothetical protein
LRHNVLQLNNLFSRLPYERSHMLQQVAGFAKNVLDVVAGRVRLVHRLFHPRHRLGRGVATEAHQGEL